MSDNNDIKRDNVPVDTPTQEPVSKDMLEFSAALVQTEKAYILILLLCGALVLGGVFYAAYASVLTGLLIAIGAIVLYVFLTSNLLYTKLGISYKSATRELTVTAFYGKDREEGFIPARLILLDVTELGDKALAHKSSASLRVLTLPHTLKVIGENVFEGCDALRTIRFGGTVEHWTTIDCGSDLGRFEGICADGTVAPTAAPDVADATAAEDLSEGAVSADSASEEAAE